MTGNLGRLLQATMRQIQSLIQLGSNEQQSLIREGQRHMTL